MITTLTAATTTFLAQNIGDVTPKPPDGPTGQKILELLSWLMWGCIIAAVAGIMICGAMLAFEKITGGGQGGNATGKLVGGLFGSIVIGGAAGLVNMLVL
ncbi:hypothetical protein [Rhodococcus sp. H29-C3]|uniref:hypothetical protein n=1 Tax=Rhodococcus sp. H29-C3 TaxID=3046307 RepID=UPI0024BB340F|nr:hypothetical protein [Rhodococcus sp. H29-C3]MDJ0363029.1 hypothetical protein [Rhodococcus sp. H29-C3]